MSKTADNTRHINNIDNIKNNKPGKLTSKFTGLIYFKNTQNSLDNVIMDLQSQKTLPDLFC